MKQLCDTKTFFRVIACVNVFQSDSTTSQTQERQKSFYFTMTEQFPKQLLTINSKQKIQLVKGYLCKKETIYYFHYFGRLCYFWCEYTIQIERFITE